MAAWRATFAVVRRCGASAYLSRATPLTFRYAGMMLHQKARSSVAVQWRSVTVGMSAVAHCKGRFFSAEALPPHKVVTLPALSPTMEVGSLEGWEKAEGELVEEGDVLARVETDKASMEMEAPHTGYVAKIVVPEGTRDIPLGKLLCIITEKEEDVAAFKDYQEPTTSSPPLEKTAPHKDVPVAPPPTQPAPPTDEQSMPFPPSTHVFVSPYARSLLAEQGRSAAGIQGTGYSGAVTSRDVIAVGGGATAAAPPAATGSFTELPLTGMRKTIAQRLVQSKRDIPHYYLTVDINMDNIISVRKAMNDVSGGEYKISVNDFLVKAAAVALRKIPEVNSSWTDTAIRRYNTVDVSIAVSTEGGLITPIVFDADDKSLRTISEESKMLAQKARSGKLRPQEFQGGTFTISNLGMYGIKSFTAVINPPQSCILAVGGTEKRVVVDEEADIGFKMANMMSVTLSCDHRVVDGAVGAQWLAIFKRMLEQPHNMLLDMK